MCCWQYSKYQVDGGEKMECVTVGLGDVTDAIKGTVYDSTRLKRLSANSTVIVMNCMFKKEGEPAVAITKNI